MVEPISPSNIIKKVPDCVIQGFNNILSERWNGHEARFTQEEVIVAILQADIKDYLTKALIYSKGMLDIESIYEAQGWSINYDKPGYNESYAANFTFTRVK